MLFKNKQDHSIKARVEYAKDISGYIWKTLHSGDTIDLKEHYGKALGLTEVQEGKNQRNKTRENKSNAKGFNAKVTKEQRESFFKELTDIDGIGEKTADDILKTYLTKEDLKKSLESGKDLPIRDDKAELINNALR